MSRKRKTGVALDAALFEAIDEHRETDTADPAFQTRSEVINECTAVGFEVLRAFETFGWETEGHAFDANLRQVLADSYREYEGVNPPSFRTNTRQFRD